MTQRGLRSWAQCGGLGPRREWVRLPTTGSAQAGVGKTDGRVANLRPPTIGGVATVTVRYVPPDEQNVEERSLGPGEVLSVGRSPVGDGITLLETNQDISRSAIELELEADGVI